MSRWWQRSDEGSDQRSGRCCEMDCPGGCLGGDHQGPGGPDDGWVLGEVQGAAPAPPTSRCRTSGTWAARAAEPLTFRAGLPATVAGDAAGLRGSRFWGVSAVGWVTGVVFGLLVAVLMARFVPARAGLLPWVVLSQTVPLIAHRAAGQAGGRQLEVGTLDWQDWMVGGRDRLPTWRSSRCRSGRCVPDGAAADGVQLDLFRAYGVGWWTTFWGGCGGAVCVVPYLLPALRLAAANAVVGTVVGGGVHGPARRARPDDRRVRAGLRRERGPGQGQWSPIKTRAPCS